jgi:hypothetical protein
MSFGCPVNDICQKVGILKISQQTKINEQTQDNVYFFLYFTGSLIQFPPHVIIYNSSKQEQDKVKPTGFVVKEQAEAEQEHIPYPLPGIQKLVNEQ